PEDPGLERGASFEAVEPGEDAEPRLLHDLLGHRPRGHVHHRHTEHRRPVTTEQLAERRLVAGPELREETALVGGRCRARGLATIAILVSSRRRRRRYGAARFAAMRCRCTARMSAKRARMQLTVAIASSQSPQPTETTPWRFSSLIS